MKMKNKASWELKVMIKSLSIMQVLNTDKENKRLQEAKQELKDRNVAIQLSTKGEMENETYKNY